MTIITDVEREKARQYIVDEMASAERAAYWGTADCLRNVLLVLDADRATLAALRTLALNEHGGTLSSRLRVEAEGLFDDSDWPENKPPAWACLAELADEVRELEDVVPQ